MKNNKYIFFFGLIIAFLLFAFLTMLFIWEEKDKPENILFRFLINFPSWLLMGGFDYWMIKLLNDKVQWKSHVFRILSGLLLSNLFVLLLSVSAHYFISPTDESYVAKYAIPIFIWNSIIIFLIEIFMYIQKQAEVEKRLAIAEKEKIHYQYETLKAQINPHFLFNSLNVLSSLTYKDADKANLFTKKLSGVYRYLLLTNEHPVITLKEELGFLESYLFLEKIRFGNAFSIDIKNDDDSLLSKNIIPVSLQLLVENALKHNITTKEEPLHIQIHITNKGITVANNIQLRNSVNNGGVGLINLQKQYTLYNTVVMISQTDTEFLVKIPYVN